MKKEYSNIFESIKNDDVTLFSASIQNNYNLSFNRFPLLSLCYLYNAKKIINEYKNLLIVSEYNKINDEPFEIYLKFKTYAGRSLRLYTNGEIVSPLEMLAIMHKDNLVKKEFKNFNLQEKQIENLKTIFRINYQNAEINQNNIKIQKERLSYNQINFHKLSMISSAIILSVICLVFIFSSIFTGFGTQSSLFYVYNQTQLMLALNGNKSYVLKNDIYLTTSVDISNFCGDFNGNNKTIYFNNIQDNPFIKTNSGTLKNINIVYQNQTDELLTKEVSSSTSLFVGENLGTIKNVNIKSSKINLSFINAEKETFFNGFALENKGNIENCSLDVSLNIKSNIDADSYFGGFVGKNYGVVNNCSFLSNKVETVDTDVSGIANINYINGKIENCKNNAEISHTTQRDSWSPNASGIVILNEGTIKNCYNYGTIFASSTNNNVNTDGVIFVGGICCKNYREIDKCLNKGQINASSERMTIYAGGICAFSTYFLNDNTLYCSIIKNCGVDNKINIQTTTNQDEKNAVVIAGTLCGYLSGRGYYNGYKMFGFLENCYSLAEFEKVNLDKINKTHFISSCVGATNLGVNLNQGVIEPFINLSKNYCLTQSDISNKIAGSIINGQISYYDDGVKKLKDDYPIFNLEGKELDEIKGYSSRDKITELEVYWND